jgi:type I restriction enzyme S subunit
MISDLKPYSALKESGVPWLGDVPEHWEVKKVKQLSDEGYKKFVDGDWIESPYITSSGIRLIQTGNIGVGIYREKGFRYISESTFEKLACTEFEPNDILVCRLGEPVGRACLAPTLGVRMITSVDVCILKPSRSVSAKFIVYAMSSARYLDWVGSLVRGSTRDRVSRSMLGTFCVPLPPLSEQCAVTRFLDYADRRIRQYIRAKQKLIKLLEEQKQAIIHRAVTRGFDSNVRLKPSGVEWLGDVPEHWSVVRVRFLFREIDRRSEAGTETHLSMSQKFGLVPSAMVEQRTLVSESYAGGKLCEVDDLVLNRLKAHLGVFALATLGGVISPDYTVLRRTRTLAAKYFEQVLRSPACRVELRRRAKGIVAGFWRLYTDDLYDIKLPVPPLDEQRLIVSSIRTATESVRAAVERAEEEISVLREFRIRLIDDVVTGKLDVRAVAAKLPDEDPDSSALDESKIPGEIDEASGDDEVATVIEESDE